LIEVGVILKAQGIKGGLKIKPLTDDPARFKRLKNVFVDGKIYPVTEYSFRDGHVFLSLDGVSDRNAAEALKDQYVYAADSDAVKPKKGSYFIRDLVGCQVFSIGPDGREALLGEVESVGQYGAADVFFVKGGQNLMFPFLKRLGAAVDIGAKKITVDAQVLSEVVVFED